MLSSINLGRLRLMRALPAIQKAPKTCHTVIVGGDDVSHGRKPDGAKNGAQRR